MGITTSIIKPLDKNIILDKALMHGDLYSIDLAIKDVTDFHYPIDNNHNTIIHSMLRYNFVSLFIHCVKEKGLKYDIRNLVGNTPIDTFITFAADKNILSGLKKINKEFEVDYNNKNIYGISLFNRICYRKALNEHMKDLYLAMTVDFNQPLVNNYYPILVFAMKNNDEMLDFLIDNHDNGYEINYKVTNDNKSNIFHFLCYNNNLTMIKKIHNIVPIDTMNLLVNEIDANKTTPLEIAIVKEYTEIVEYFVVNDLIKYNKVRPEFYKSIMDTILVSKSKINTHQVKPLIDIGNNSEDMVLSDGLIKDTEQIQSDLLTDNIILKIESEPLGNLKVYKYGESTLMSDCNLLDFN